MAQQKNQDITREKQRDPAEGQELTEKDIDQQLAKQEPLNEKGSQPTDQRDETIEPDFSDELSDEKGEAA